MTKAERIFKDTYTACRVLAKRNGLVRNPDGTPVTYRELITEERVCTRTFNRIQKLINTERKTKEIGYKVGAYDEGDYDRKIFELDMVQKTLDNHIKMFKDFEVEA